MPPPWELIERWTNLIAEPIVFCAVGEHKSDLTIQCDILSNVIHTRTHTDCQRVQQETQSSMGERRHLSTDARSFRYDFYFDRFEIVVM